MIVGWLRMMFWVLCASSLAYGLLSLYARSLRREALENQWQAGDRSETRQAFVAAGMKRYEQGLRRRLLWLVFLLPFALISAIFFYINWSFE